MLVVVTLLATALKPDTKLRELFEPPAEEPSSTSVPLNDPRRSRRRSAAGLAEYSAVLMLVSAAPGLVVAKEFDAQAAALKPKAVAAGAIGQGNGIGDQRADTSENKDTRMLRLRVIQETPSPGRAAGATKSRTSARDVELGSKLISTRQ